MVFMKLTRMENGQFNNVGSSFSHDSQYQRCKDVCVCVSVCERERERESESMSMSICVYVCVCV